MWDIDRAALDATTSLPVIDIGLLHGDGPRGRRLIAARLRQACIATGFFYVANHGVDAALPERLFAAAKRFFDQPLAVKRQVAMSGADMERGYEGVGGQMLDAATGLDRKESIFIGIDWPPDHPLVRAGTPHHGPNRWPQGLPGWRVAVEAYFAAMERLARTLLDGLALSLDLPWGHFDPCLVDHMSSLRLLHYPPHPTADPNREVGCGAHTDWGALTVLAQDDTGGLEIRQPSGEWIAATPVPGTFVVNLGDMMARWTNDLYASTPHRVLNRSAKDRYSAAFFFDPAFHTRVECLPTCQGAGRPARYPPISSGEHLAAMYRKTYVHAG
ncbi:MAG TPA: 2-oxoglutarate and iron-dependent oxygenase domain-containing protein [Stellaceae bacterium]|nr:2-oxoglutarate and iron-dependent oxygenase domain-containing protein [Stellaceae bacterium]